MAEVKNARQSVGGGDSPHATGVTVGAVIELMDSLYPPELAADWDSIGLVCGDPERAVRRILLAVDPSEEASMEAIDRGADLLITHHPLFLSGVTSVASIASKGRLLHRLIKHDVALFTAHTNADAASPGVSDALDEVLGLADVSPLDGDESGRGIGRIGRLREPMLLTDFAQIVAERLPYTDRGINIAGELLAPVRRVAVCGGAGDSLMAEATRAGADVYVTADLRHHRSFEHRADGGCFLIDVSHWASEWPWLLAARTALLDGLAALSGGDEIDVVVSLECTDPWTAHRASVDSEL